MSQATLAEIKARFIRKLGQEQTELLLRESLVEAARTGQDYRNLMIQKSGLGMKGVRATAKAIGKLKKKQNGREPRRGGRTLQGGAPGLIQQNLK